MRRHTPSSTPSQSPGSPQALNEQHPASQLAHRNAKGHRRRLPGMPWRCSLQTGWRSRLLPPAGIASPPPRGSPQSLLPAGAAACMPPSFRPSPSLCVGMGRGQHKVRWWGRIPRSRPPAPPLNAAPDRRLPRQPQSPDLSPAHPLTRFTKVLRDLGGLAAPGLAHHDGHGVVLHQVQELLPVSVHGQRAPLFLQAGAFIPGKAQAWTQAVLGNQRQQGQALETQGSALWCAAASSHPSPPHLLWMMGGGALSTSRSVVNDSPNALG